VSPNTGANLAAEPMSIHPDTRMGAVRLRVADLELMAAFYERAIGLRVINRREGAVTLGPAGGPALVDLAADPAAPPRPPRTTGLFHLAIVVPTRPDLARALRRVVAADHFLTGASDHFVSEALYLDDPEGNGIELYRDRPRAQWRDPDGGLRFGTVPLDVRGLAEQPGTDDPPDGMPAGTRMGHVHLQVGDLEEAGDFYVGTLGFDLMVRIPPALFISAGGYHHHLGLNVFYGEGMPPPPDGALGLHSFDVVLPDRTEVERMGERARAAGIAVDEVAGGLELLDPSRNRLRLTDSGG